MLAVFIVVIVGRKKPVVLMYAAVASCMARFIRWNQQHADHFWKHDFTYHKVPLSCAMCYISVTN